MPKTIVVPGTFEEWDERTETFIPGSEGGVLILEHSLKSVADWESKWHKAYFGRERKTEEESLDYIRFMIVNDADPALCNRLSPQNLMEISKYLRDPMTATTFRENRQKQKGRREIVTAEIVYYWMLLYGIPFTCETWPINRLMTLIQVCSVKGAKPEKKSQQQLLREHAELNAYNRKLLNTKG